MNVGERPMRLAPFSSVVTSKAMCIFIKLCTKCRQSLGYELAITCWTAVRMDLIKCSFLSKGMAKVNYYVNETDHQWAIQFAWIPPFHSQKGIKAYCGLVLPWGLLSAVCRIGSEAFIELAERTCLWVSIIALVVSFIIFLLISCKVSDSINYHYFSMLQ